MLAVLVPPLCREFLLPAESSRLASLERSISCPRGLAFLAYAANVNEREEAFLHGLPLVRRDQLARFTQFAVCFVRFVDGHAPLSQLRCR